MEPPSSTVDSSADQTTSEHAHDSTTHDENQSNPTIAEQVTKSTPSHSLLNTTNDHISTRNIIQSICLVRQTQPIYTRLFVGPTSSRDSLLRFEHMAHTSLDIIEEKLARSASSTRDAFLGYLFPSELYKLYAYVTNCDLRIICIVSALVEFKEADLKNLLKEVHGIYVKFIANPFSDVSNKITSEGFDAKMDSLVRSFEPKR